MSLPLGCLAVAAAGDDAAAWGAAVARILESHGAAAAAAAERWRAERLSADSDGSGSGEWRLVLTGGTVTTAAALLQALPSYSRAAVHRRRLAASDLDALAAALQTAAAREAAVARHPWLTPARAASLGPGCAALAVVVRWLAARVAGGSGSGGGGGGGGGAADCQFIVSDSDLLDGAAARLLAEV